MIRVEGLTATYGKKKVFEGLSFEAKGITLVLGPNGAGKSTLLRCVGGGGNCSGYIEVFGKPVQRGAKGLPPEKRGVAYLPQGGFSVGPLKVEDALSLAGEVDEETVEALGIKSLLKFKLKELSGGQLKRVSIAMILLSKRRAWLLDEPLAGIDKEGRKEITLFIAEKARAVGATVLWATHFPEPQEVADGELSLGRR